MRWRTLSRFPDYEISDHGDVRRRTEGYNRPTGYVLKGSTSKRKNHRYRRVTLVALDGTRLPHKVANLVCEAFWGPKPSPKHEVAHADGNSTNDFYKNLRWATKKEKP
jgi:hypothetical protein